MTRFVAEFMGQTVFVPGRETEADVETAMGLLPQRMDLPIGAQVEVVVKPDDVALLALKRVGADGSQGSPNGRLLSRRFTGMAYVYCVGLPDGMEIHSWQSHTSIQVVGEEVRAVLRLDHALTCSCQGSGTDPQP